MAKSTKRQAASRVPVARKRPTLDGLIGQFTADAAAFSDRKQDGTKLTAAVGYWLGYPVLFEVIECYPEATAEEKYNASSSLALTHSEAVRFLMTEAERWKLDSSPLWEEGRVCRELFAKRDLYKYDPFIREGVQDLWPDCLGTTRYRLPDSMQAAIRDGEAVFMRVALLNEMDPDELRKAGRAVVQSFVGQKPLTEACQAAYNLICSKGPLSGKEIVNRLGISSESNFTAHYVPELKQHGIENRPGLGYYHPDFYKPSPSTLGGKR